MKKLSIILMLAVMALFIFGVTAMAAEVEHRVYVEFASASEFSARVDSELSVVFVAGTTVLYTESETSVDKFEFEETLNEGITLGYEAAFATSNESLKILVGGNFLINSKFSESGKTYDIDVFNVYSGVKYQLSDNKIKPYLVGRLGLGKVDMNYSFEGLGGANIGLYAGAGIGIKPNDKMSVELMYLYNNNDYDCDARTLSEEYPSYTVNYILNTDMENTYRRWVLTAGCLF